MTEKIIHGSKKKKKKDISCTKCQDCLCSTAGLKRDASCATRETAGRNTNQNAQISLGRPLQLEPRYHLLISGEVQQCRALSDSQADDLEQEGSQQRSGTVGCFLSLEIKVEVNR